MDVGKDQQLISVSSPFLVSYISLNSFFNINVNNKGVGCDTAIICSYLNQSHNFNIIGN